MPNMMKKVARCTGLRPCDAVADTSGRGGSGLSVLLPFVLSVLLSDLVSALLSALVSALSGLSFCLSLLFELSAGSALPVSAFAAQTIPAGCRRPVWADRLTRKCWRAQPKR